MDWGGECSSEERIGICSEIEKEKRRAPGFNWWLEGVKGPLGSTSWNPVGSPGFSRPRIANGRNGLAGRTQYGRGRGKGGSQERSRWMASGRAVKEKKRKRKKEKKEKGKGMKKYVKEKNKIKINKNKK